MAVADALGVTDTVHYLHTIKDVVRAARNRYTVRSRLSSVRGSSVGAIRSELARVSEKVPGHVLGYVVRVPGHAMLLRPCGDTLVDTDPRKRDRRRVTHLYVVYEG